MDNDLKERVTRLLRYAKELEIAGATVMLPDWLEKIYIKLKAKETDKKEKKTTFKQIPLTEDLLSDLIMDSVVPACCIYGCEVEPDGYCSHGNPSVLIHYGLE